MGKNVLILLGSPRKEGNSHLLAKAFAEGAESAGHTVTYLSLIHISMQQTRGTP